MIAEFAAGLTVLFLIFGPYLIDAYAEHRRAVRASRTRGMSLTPPARRGDSPPSSGSLGQARGLTRPACTRPSEAARRRHPSQGLGGRWE